jgi:hypothetical protein
MGDCHAMPISLRTRWEMGISSESAGTGVMPI